MDLREWRLSEGLTLVQLAKKLDVTHVTLSRIENKIRRPGNKLTKGIYRITGGKVQPNDLFPTQKTA